METTNQTFSFGRFALYMRKYLTDNKTTLLCFAGIIFLALLFASVVVPWLTGMYGAGNSMKSDMGTLMRFMFSYGLLFWIFSIFAGSMFYSSLSKKGVRVSELTLPASNAEKFICYFVIYCLAFNLFFVGSVFFTDAIRVWIYSGEAHAHNIEINYIGRGVAQLFETKESRVISLIGILFLLGTQSLFALGSCIWTKNSLIKTALAGTVIQTLCSMLTMLGVKVFAGCHISIAWFQFLDNINQILLWECILGFVWIAFNYWTGFMRYKDMEIINRW